MNGPFLVAQLSGSTPQTSSAPARNIKLEKPQNGAAVTVHLDGQTQLDFTDVASEKLTFVQVGDKLVVLFDNQSTVTVEPVFGPDGHPLADVAFEMAPDRTLTGDQFASLFPITTDQSVLPAAGNGGPTAGANFSDAHVDALTTGTALGLLTADNLGSTSSPFALPAGNPPPVAGPIPTVTVNEDALPGGNPGAPGVITVTGSLNIDFGTETSGRNFSFAATQAGLSGLSSDGQTVHLFVTTVGGLPTMIGYVGTDPSIVANDVFTVSLNANSTLDGTFTFTLLRPLDHPIIGTEDTLNLSVDVIATDGTGAVTPAVINVNVVDNAPILIAAEETHSTITDPVTGAVATSTGSLGISWGADNFNDHVDGGVSATTGQAGDRAVVFSDAIVTATGDVAGVASSIGSLTSNGIALQYVLLNNGTELVAYTGGTAPTTFPTDAATAASEHVVFTVSLSDASSTGNYVISQYQPLDHNSGATLFDSIDVSFHFTATDSDGDPVSGTLTATIDDTVPTVTESLVTHSTITDPLIPSQATATGTLGIIWGADSANATIDGGVTAADGDRAVIFGNAAVTATGSAGGVVTGITGLTSEHQAVNYVLLDNGTVLVAYTGATAPTTVPAAPGGGLPLGLHLDSVQPVPNIVFVVTLTDDSATGGYTVTQYQPLDHIADGTKFDSINLTFNFTAVDSDGDPATGTLTVTVDDTTPVIAGSIADQTVTEQALPDGNHVKSETLIATESLGINWGADNEIVTSVGGFGRTLSFLAGDDSTVIPGGSAAVSSLALSVLGEQGAALSSGGVPLVYTVTANANGGETLTAFQGTTSGAVVFTLSLDPTASNGNYTFTLDGALDHGANSNSMSLAFTVQATDADGDAVQQHFTIDVQDDVPVLNGTLVAAESVFEDGLKGGNGSDTTFAGTTAVPEALNINWGADDAIHSVTDATGRTLSFLADDNTTVIAGGTSAVPSLAMSITGSEQGAALSSGGVALVYTVTANDNGGETLTAFKGTGGAEIFTLTLDPTQAHGGYVFNLLGTLDDASNSNTIGLTFTVQAADADGDATTTQFTVNVQDDVPVVSATAVAAVSVFEGGLLGGNGSSPDPTFAGSTKMPDALNINWGADDDTRATGDSFGRTLSFLAGDNSVITGGAVSSLAMGITGSEQSAALSSGGVALVYTVTANDNGGETLTAFKGAGGAEIFTLTLDPTQAHGGYVFNLMGPLDDASNSNTIGLTFTVQAADADGDATTTQFTVDVQDDVPVLSGTLVAAESVFEDGLKGGNGSDTTSVGSVTPEALNINWGADDDTRATGDSFGRTLSFLAGDNSVITGGAVSSLAMSITGSEQSGALSSGGVALVYTVTTNDNGGETLTAFKGAGGAEIFTLTLDPTQAHGGYVFNLLGTLDDASNSNTVGLTFTVQAADADGDATTTQFTVNVQDDVPVVSATAVAAVSVFEGGLLGGNGSSPDPTFAGSTKMPDALNINWGADDDTRATGDSFGRTLSFLAGDNSVITGGAIASFAMSITGSEQTAALSSGGVALVYTVTANDNGGETLTAFKGAGGVEIFTLTLDPTQPNGGYVFNLLGPLDDASNSNTIGLTFTVQAADADGDTVNTSFTVNVQDDVPVVGTPDTVTVLEHTLVSQPSASMSGSLGVNFGADGPAAVADGTVVTTTHTFTFDNGTNVGAGFSVTSPEVEKNFGFTSLSGTHTNGQTVPVVFKETDGHSFELSSVSLGLFGTPTPGMSSQVDVFGLDANGNVIAGAHAVVTITTLTNGDTGETTMTFDPTGTALAGLQVYGLTFAPVSSFSGRVFVDNLNIESVTADNSQTVVSAPVEFANLSSAIANISIIDSNGTGHPAAGLTSGGVAVQYELLDAVTLVAYTGSAPTSATASNVVFSVVLSENGANPHGAYDFTLLQALDDLPASVTDLKLSFSFTATDSDGDTAPGSFTVDVQDDVPTTSGILVAAVSVFEGGLNGGNGSSPDPTSAGTTKMPVALNINWGADDGTHSATDTSGRTLSFLQGDDSTVIQGGTAFSSLGMSVTGTEHGGPLGSGGVELVYTVTANDNGGETLTAFKGAGGAEIFTLTLDPTQAHGGYVFDLMGPLDDGGSAIGLTFTVQAADADGDSINTSFTVNVQDDVPAIGTSLVGDVSEDGPLTLTNAPLVINFGADNGSFTGSDRALTFTDNGVAATDPSGKAVTLSSYGEAISIGFIGTELIGYTGTSAPTSTSDPHIVFTATLSEATGTYDFTLNQPLDHPAPVGTNDSINLTFDITATDADGSQATGHFTVNVDAAGSIGSIDYNTETSGVFVNLSDSSFTEGTQTLASHSATDLASGGGHVIGIDALGTIADATGGSGNDVLVAGSSAGTLNGGAGDDLLVAGSANEQMIGGSGTDTVKYTASTLTTASFSYDQATNSWVVTTTGQGTDHLQGVEVVTDGTHRFLLVGGGSEYTTIQQAINAAQSGDTILIAPGSYTETTTASAVSSTPFGLYINTPNLTLQGYSSVDGSAITTAAQAEASGPTVISGAENDFGANFLIGTSGSGTTIEGLHLAAGPDTTNKLLEITANNVTVKNDFIDTFVGGKDTGAAAIYLDGQGVAITGYLIDHNILNQGIYVASGTGTPGTISTSQIISNNEFLGSYDPATDSGRYDMVAVQGNIPGFETGTAQIPTIDGNTRDDNSAPFIFRMTESNAALFPTASQLATIIADNTDVNTSYAYVLNADGTPHLIDRNLGSGPFEELTVANGIGTLDAGFEPGNLIFGDLRNTMASGDTVIVQSVGHTVSDIVVDNLTIQATASSTDLNLTLDNTGAFTVKTITLGDYATGLGANVNVTGNDQGDTITGNSGNNDLTGGAGADTFIYTVGGGHDLVDGRGGTDTQIVNGIATAETFNINPIDASHLGINIVAGTNVAAPATTANAEISDTNVEEIVVNLGSAGDTVIVTGDLSGTGVASSTITINGGVGDDTVNLFSFKSNEDVVFNGAGNGAGGDTVILGFALHDAVAAPSYAPVLDSGGHLIGAEITYTSADGVVTDTFTNVEHFEFTDGTLSIGQIFPPTGVASASVADTAAANVNTVVASGDALSTITDVDAGTTLLVTAVNNSAGNVGADVAGTYGTLHLDSNGSYTYTANAALDALTPGQNPTDVFHFTVADSNGGVSTTTLTFNITGAADTPVVSSVDAGTVADTSGVDAGQKLAQGNLLTGDTDRDSGVTLAVTKFGGVTITAGGEDVADPYGTLHVNPDGSYTFTAGAGLDALSAGQSVSFLNTFTVTSSDGAVAPQAGVEFLFTGTADTPIITSGAAGVTEAEGTAASNVVYQTVATDADTGAVLTYTLAGADKADFAISSSGAVTFVAPPNFETQHVFNIEVDVTSTTNINGTIGTAQASQAVTINVSDLPPVISSPASAAVNEGVVGGTAVYTAVAADPAGGTVHYSLTGADATAFTINSTNGVVTINNTPDFETKPSYSFSVNASDPSGMSNSEAVTVSVTDLPPVISSPASAAVNEGVAGETAVYTAVAADPAGGTVHYSLTGTDATAFTINATTGVVTINNTPDFETKPSYSFSVNASDPSGMSNTEAVTVVVNDLPPVITSPTTASVVEGTAALTAVYTAMAADPGGGTVHYSLTGTDAAAFTVNSTTGVVTINNVPDFETKPSYSFSVNAVDPSGMSSSEAVTVHVTDVAPVNTVPGTQTDNENANLVFSATNGDAISVFDVAGGNLTETLTVLHGTLTLEQETGLSFTTGDGTADTTMTFSGSQSAINAALNGLIYTPGSNYTGPDTLQITSNDGQQNPSSTVAINVQLVDHAPVAVNDTYTGSISSGTPPGTGWTLDSANGHYYEVVGGNVSWAQANAAAIAAGGYLATITSAAENAFILNLNGLTAQSQNLWLGGSDAATEGTWKWVTGPEAGTTFFNGDPSGQNNFQGTAVPGQYTNFGIGEPNNGVGFDSGENYLEMLTPFGNGIWNDGTGLAATDGSQADFVGYVMEYGGQIVVPTENTPVLIAASALLANDSDPDAGDTFSITSVQNAVHGTVSLSADHQTVTFTPDANYFGAATFTYTITDSHGLSSTATVSLNLAEVYYPPVAVADAVSVNEDALAAATTRGTGVLANDTDQNASDQATFAVSAVLAGTSGTASGVSGINATVVQGIYGALSMHADGTYSYTPNDTAAEALGQGVIAHDVFTYTMQDASGQTSNTTLTFNITGQDDAPVNSVPGAQTVPGNTSLVLSSMNGDAISVSDVDNNSLTVTLSVANGTLTLHQENGLTFTTGGDGTASMTFTGSVTNIDNALNGLTYAPASNYMGSDTIHILSNDGTLSDSDTVGITVTPANQAPMIGTSGLAGSVTEGVTPGSTTNVLHNGGFETGDLSNWTLSATDTGDDRVVGNPVRTGSFSMEFGQPGSDATLSQTVATVAGQSYTVDYWLTNGGSPADFSASWNGVVIPGSALSNTSEPGFTEFSFTVVASSNSSTLQFAAFNNPSWWYLDDVSVTGLALPGVEKSSGNFTFTDANAADTHTVTQATPTFQWSGGTLTTQLATLIADSSLTLTETDSTNVSNGSVAWSYQIADSALQFLGAGQTLTETYAVTVTDNHGASAITDVVITINGDNPAVNHVPGAQTVAGNGSLTFNSAHGDAITVSDTDNNILTETLTVSQGTLSLSGETGLTFTAGDGTADATMTFSGTQSAINNALSGMTYAPANGYAGADTLEIDSNDGTHVTTNTVGITVQAPPNHAPVINGGTFTGSVTEDASYNAVSSGNLILNGGFDFYNGTFYTLQAWNTTGSVSVVGGYNSGGSAFLNAPSTLSQTIATVAGVTYSIDFFASDFGTNTVSENGVVVGTLSGNDSSFTEYTYQFVATSASTTISFAATSMYYLDIDQISVQSVPGTPGVETAAGTINFTDADHTDTHTITQGSPTFVWSGGALTVPELAALNAANASTLTLVETDSTGSGSGSVAWSYQIQDSAIQFLQANQTLTETYSVTINDGHGGVTSQNVAVTIHGDTTPPTATISSTITTDTGATGTISSGGVTKDTTLRLSGTVSDVNGVALVQVFDGSTLLGTATVTGGNWSFTTAALGSGSHSFTAKATDNAGNTTTTSAVTATVDTTAPAQPAITGFSTDSGTVGDHVTSDTSLKVSGTAEANSTVTLFQNGTSVGTTTANGSGSWSVTDGNTLSNGTTYQFTATAKDTAGNVSVASASYAATIDTAAPNAPGNLMHSGSSVSWNAATDNSGGSGIDHYLYQVDSGTRTTANGSYTSTTSTSGTWNNTAGTTPWTLFVEAVDVAGNTSSPTFLQFSAPAGVSGEAINLALADYSDHSMVSLTVAGIPAGWALSEGTLGSDGNWTVQTNDVASLSITSPAGYVGALLLQVSESWTDSNGVAHNVYVSDNVEAFAKGAPVFAWSGDDTLTASTDGNDTLVFANQIGTDVVHNFDTAHDKIDLIGFNGISSFADVQAHLSSDASGNAVVTLADGETITLDGVSAASLNAGDFEFNQTPVSTNTGDMAIGDGALLPLSGTVDNTGSIHLGSAGSETDLEIVQHGATLQGGGTLVMSDNSENVIFGSDPSVTLTNVDNIISGAGQIGEGQMTLVNEGSIIADGTHALVIDTGVNTVINSGTLESTGAGGLTVQSDLANTGLLWANGGDLHLNGAVSGTGSALISGNANLEIGGAFNEQIQFDNGATGTLTLDHSIDFKGILSGFGDHNSIDLTDILAATSSLNYTENAAGTGGTLTVNDGSHTANIAFAGQYATSDFHVATDAGNHALIQIEQHAHQAAAAA